MYRSPFRKKCTVTTVFKKPGNWRAGYHTGLDLVCDDKTLVSPADGTVSFVGYDGDGYGNYIIIHTDDKRSILMAHFAATPVVSAGQKIAAGDRVGTMGSTGNSTGAHLHIEVANAAEWNYNEKLVDPAKYIDFGDFSSKVEMKRGDKSDGVFALKLALREMYRMGMINAFCIANGAFGAGTENAVKQAQALVKMPVTGKADEKLLSLIDKALLDEFLRRRDEAAEKNSEIKSLKKALDDETALRKKWQANYADAMRRLADQRRKNGEGE